MLSVKMQQLQGWLKYFWGSVNWDALYGMMVVSCYGKWKTVCRDPCDSGTISCWHVSSTLAFAARRGMNFDRFHWGELAQVHRMSLPSVSHGSEDDQYIVGFISICFCSEIYTKLIFGCFSFLVYTPNITINPDSSQISVYAYEVNECGKRVIILLMNGSHDQLLSCSCNCSS
jgi:hypothetical protein